MKRSGEIAEDMACDYLSGLGFEIIARNYKTKWYEIDIIAKRKKVLHFVEVKYRKTQEYGYAQEYVTPSKIRQLKFAAQAWVAAEGWDGYFVIDVIGITGELHPKNLEFVQNITS